MQTELTPSLPASIQSRCRYVVSRSSVPVSCPSVVHPLSLIAEDPLPRPPAVLRGEGDAAGRPGHGASADRPRARRGPAHVSARRGRRGEGPPPPAQHASARGTRAARPVAGQARPGRAVDGRGLVADGHPPLRRRPRGGGGRAPRGAAGTPAAPAAGGGRGLVHTRPAAPAGLRRARPAPVDGGAPGEATRCVTRRR